MNETTTKQKMSVRFNDDATESYVVDDSLSSLVPPNMLWYSAEEYKLFRKDRPCKTKSENISRRQFVQSLLSQQWEHKKIGISDPKGLQMLSKACSKGPRRRARQLAAENERDVVDFLERTITVPPKKSRPAPVVDSLERRKVIPPRNSFSAVIFELMIFTGRLRLSHKYSRTKGTRNSFSAVIFELMIFTGRLRLSHKYSRTKGTYSTLFE
jgi:hypothetical protein